MSFNSFKARELIQEDIAGKKEFNAKHKLICGTCNHTIELDEPFYFVGNNKICTDCLGEMQELIK